MVKIDPQGFRGDVPFKRDCPECEASESMGEEIMKHMHKSHAICTPALTSKTDRTQISVTMRTIAACASTLHTHSVHFFGDVARASHGGAFEWARVRDRYNN
eukprot:Tamp_10683.p2 GENE.Tamp_10683~~Tamp_10683.p2  ORF type:complete len:102 (-),score=8.12 Tamp_10683:919-1224(-)